MKPNVMLIVTSLVSIILLSLHISEDIVLGFATGGLTNIFGIAVLVVYLCGTLLLSDRRSGQIILLVGSIIAVAMPIMHMSGAGVGVKRSAGAFFFVWTLYALGVNGTFGAILSVLALRARTPEQANVPRSQVNVPLPNGSAANPQGNFAKP